MPDALHYSWRHRFAALTAAATFLLLGAGGLVTSHGVGMAVPDWPNSYGYNMFFFPVSDWVGGIFYEHTHRLIASGVGLLTGVLALWLYGASARRFMRWTGLAIAVAGLAIEVGLPRRWSDAVVVGSTGLVLFGASFVWPRCPPAERWLRRLGLAAFGAVVLQGVLGGLRVVLLKPQIGIAHALLAQLFFVLACAIALFTSRWWRESAPKGRDNAEGAPAAFPGRWLFVVTTGLILAQLLVGAAMRHQHAGLAIPDFPLAYGRLWPATDPASIDHYNQQRIEITSGNPITAFQIELQMVHRLLAALVLTGVALSAWITRPSGARRSALPVAARRLALGWLGLIGAQVVLGACTIWTNKAADVATAHVLVGALSLAAGSFLCIISFRRPAAVLARSANRIPSSGSARADALPGTAAAAHLS